MLAQEIRSILGRKAVRASPALLLLHPAEQKAAQTARAQGWGLEPGSPRLWDMVSPTRIWDLG